MNKFQNYILQMLQYGSIVDFNTPDTPGGTVSGEGGSSDNNDNSTIETMHQGDTTDNSEDDTTDNSEGDTTDNDSEGSADNNDSEGSADNNDSTDTSIDDRITALTGQISSLVNAFNKDTGSSNDGEGGSGGDISSLEHDDLVAMMADDPKGFISNLTSVIHKQISQDVREENATSRYNNQVESTIDQYADNNPDFEKMWDEGKLQSYMEKNPGHNAISAHMAITMEQRIMDAKKEGAEKAAKDFDTKSKHQVLNGGPSISPNQRDAALKNPEKFGGRAAVLAARAGIT